MCFDGMGNVTRLVRQGLDTEVGDQLERWQQI